MELFPIGLLVVGKMAGNVKRLCDGGFYTQRLFKTAIAKPGLYAVRFTEIINNKILKKWNLLKNTTGQMNRD